ncbi:MAG: zinc-dependent peptidase, partial [Nostoc sp. C3-bin3]|nr:zinc-dependent peptidase [Nostoc sp. C3-bin3]
MLKTIIVFLFIILIIGLIFGIDSLIKLRRRWLASRPFLSHFTVIIERNLPFYKHLPESLRQRFQCHINILLCEKKFKGCEGLHITDEIKVTIAAIAALLLLNDQGNYFSKLRIILVYPSAFIANQTIPFGEYFLEEKQVKAGESWGTGIVVLSWENIRYDVRHWQDGRNVV